MTHGTIYPGLIELHNHLSYDVLPLWAVPQQFANRDGWSKGPVYRGTISGPMQVLGKTDTMGEAVVQHVVAASACFEVHDRHQEIGVVRRRRHPEVLLRGDPEC